MNERPWIQPDRHTSRRAGVGRLVLLPPFGATVSVAVCMLGMALAATALPAQVTYIDREYQIKAAYLYHLIKYVRWPETSRLASQNAGKSPFVITVLGQNPFGGSLKHIAATRRIRGRPIRLEFVQNPDAIPDCHIVFVPATTSEKFRQSVLRETRSADSRRR
ncbi:MAG: YfiR family protein [Planctomycetes bacterium]|nr:YfiR family protein [Planctomycetota bacterium]